MRKTRAADRGGEKDVVASQSSKRAGKEVTTQEKKKENMSVSHGGVAERHSESSSGSAGAAVHRRSEIKLLTAGTMKTIWGEKKKIPTVSHII